MPLLFPSLLRPTTSEQVLINGRSWAIPKVELQLRQWEGISLTNTLNGKPLIDFGGRPVFAELCLYELVRLSGWQARWVKPYGAPAKAPRLLTAWADDQLTAQHHKPISDPRVASLLQRIADVNGGTYVGCWDIVGWHLGPSGLCRTQAPPTGPYPHHAAGLAGSCFATGAAAGKLSAGGVGLHSLNQQPEAIREPAIRPPGNARNRPPSPYR